MLGWVMQLFAALAGLIASIFVARDALNFTIVQMVILFLLFTFCVALITFWQQIKEFFRNRFKK